MGMIQPVYEIIKAPTLARWDQASLITWNREWEQYLMKIRHRCNVTGESFEGVVATAKGSVEPAVLNTLATYVPKKRVEGGNDTEILAQVQQRCRFLMNAFRQDPTTLFWKSLKMDMQVDDCDARVFQYFHSFTKMAEENGLQALISSGYAASLACKDRRKARCAILVENIRPIMRLIKYERRDCKINDPALFDLILEPARVHQRFHVQRVARAAPPMRGQLQYQQQSKRNQKPVKVVVPAAEKKTLAPPRDGCLKCRGAHWLDECRTATAEQRAEVLARLREAKNSRTGSVRSKTVSAPVRANMVRINGVVDIPYILDSGADHTMIPRVVVTSLQELNVNLDVKELATPLSAYLADGRRADCADQVTVALVLGVHMRDVQCL